MPTGEDLKMLKDRQRTLSKGGIHVDLIANPATKVQWYRADGTPLPNLLPADAYHIRLFEKKKGWSMVPPNGATTRPAPTGTSHVHRYAKPMGSPCKITGCTATRTQPFKPHKKSRS